MQNGKNIIYHGSNVEVPNPKILVNGHYKDFGYGFYCINIEKQAMRWALTRKGNSVVNNYSYTENTELKVLSFQEMTEEWLEFVVSCRRGQKHSYDIVEGPMADNQIWDYVEDYTAGNITKEALEHLISVANVLHCENPLQVEDDWIEEYHLEEGDFDITDVDKELAEKIPTALEMGKVYQRLISDTEVPEEDYVDGIIRVYNNEICDTIDNYNCSAFYEPSYIIARAYQNGGF